MWQWSFGSLAYQPAGADLRLPDSTSQWRHSALGTLQYPWGVQFSRSVREPALTNARMKIMWLDFLGSSDTPAWIHRDLTLCCDLACDCTSAHVKSRIFKRTRDIMLMNCGWWDLGLTCIAYKRLVWDQLWQRKKKEYLMLLLMGSSISFLQICWDRSLLRSCHRCCWLGRIPKVVKKMRSMGWHHPWKDKVKFVWQMPPITLGIWWIATYWISLSSPLTCRITAEIFQLDFVAL